MDELVQLHIYSNDPQELESRLRNLSKILSTSAQLDPSIIVNHLVPRTSQLLASKDLPLFRCGLGMLDLTLSNSPMQCLEYLNKWSSDVLACLSLVAGGRSSSRKPQEDCVSCLRALDGVFRVCLVFGGSLLLRDVVNVHLPTSMSVLMKLLIVSNEETEVSLIEDRCALLLQMSPILKKWTLEFTSLMKPYEDRLSSLIIGQLFSSDLNPTSFRSLVQLLVSLSNCCQTKQKCIDKHLSLQFAGLCGVQTHLDMLLSGNLEEEPFRRVESSFTGGIKFPVPNYGSDYIHSYPRILDTIKKLLQYLEIVYEGRFLIAPAKVAMGETFDVLRRALVVSVKYSRRKIGSDLGMYSMLMSLIPSLHCAFLKYTAFFVGNVVGKRALRYRTSIADLINSIITESSSITSVKLEVYNCVNTLLPVMDHGFVRKIQKALVPVIVKDLSDHVSCESSTSDDRISDIEQVTASSGKGNKKRKAHGNDSVSSKRNKNGDFVLAGAGWRLMSSVCQYHGSVLAESTWKAIDNISVCSLMNRQSKPLKTLDEQQYSQLCLTYLQDRVQYCPDAMHLSALMIGLANFRQESLPVSAAAALLRPRRPFIGSHENARKHALEQEEIDLEQNQDEVIEVPRAFKEAEIQTEVTEEVVISKPAMQTIDSMMQTEEPEPFPVIYDIPSDSKFEVSIEENPEIFNTGAPVLDLEKDEPHQPQKEVITIPEPVVRNIDSDDDFGDIMIIDADPDE